MALGILAQRCLPEMPAPSNRVPVRLARGNKAELDANLPVIQEGECVYARDEDALYVKDNGNLVNVAQGTGTVFATKSGEVVWTIGAYQGSLGYLFSGDGLAGNEINPTLYLLRSKQYRWVNPLTEHGIEIYQDSSFQVPYEKGLSNPGAISGDQSNSTIFIVPQDAPDQLYYKATDSVQMSGVIKVLTNQISADLDDLDDVDASAPVNGMTILYSAATGMWEAANLASGGAVDLKSLTDVDIENPQDGQALIYDLSLNQWINKETEPGVGDPQRSTSVVIGRASDAGMLGGVDPLGTASAFESAGFNLQFYDRDDTYPFEDGDGILYFIFPSSAGILGNGFLPLNRADLPVESGAYLYSDGRLSFGNFAVQEVVRDRDDVYNSFGANSTLNFAPFIGDTNFSLQMAGSATGIPYGDGNLYTVMRAEYSDGVTGYIAYEVWLEQGEPGKTGTNFFVFIGNAVGGFTIPVGPLKTGVVFGENGKDSSAYAVENGFPGLTPQGNYACKFYFQGSGYMLDRILDVDITTLPQQDGDLLKWSTSDERWVPGGSASIGAKGPTSPGRPGQTSTDGTFFYICTALDTWKRVGINSFT